MEPLGDVADPASLDPESLGFMCGIEVHQQLATGKLHSRQPGELHDITIETYQMIGSDIIANLGLRVARVVQSMSQRGLKLAGIVHLFIVRPQIPD